MSYDHEAMVAHLRAMFADEGLAVRIGTGEKDADGKGISTHVNVQPWLMNRETLLHTLSLGFARWHGQHLNNVPAEGGAKRDAFIAMVQEAHAGKTPQEFTGRRSGGGKAAKVQTPFDEAVLMFVNESIERLVAQLKPLVAAKRIDVAGSGKNGKLIAKDWPKVAAKVARLSSYVKDGDWNWAAMSDHVKETRMDEILGKAEEIAAAREAAEAVKEVDDLDSIDFEF